MSLIWSPPARFHLRQAQAFIAEDNPRAPAKTAARILNAAERLIAFPASGRPDRVPHTRELVVPGTPFILPYRVRGEVIEILLVLHAARNWPED